MEQQQQDLILRMHQKVLAGEEPSLEELREALAILRAGRVMPTKNPAKSPKPMSSEEIDELFN